MKRVSAAFLEAEAARRGLLIEFDNDLNVAVLKVGRREFYADLPASRRDDLVAQGVDRDDLEQSL